MFYSQVNKVYYLSNLRIRVTQRKDDVNHPFELNFDADTVVMKADEKCEMNNEEDFHYDFTQISSIPSSMLRSFIGKVFSHFIVFLLIIICFCLCHLCTMLGTFLIYVSTSLSSSSYFSP